MKILRMIWQFFCFHRWQWDDRFDPMTDEPHFICEICGKEEGL